MMTTVHRRRKTRRFRLMRGATSFPPTWLPLPPEALPITGSARPGRGGRRRRKAERAKIRARIGRGVERKRWPLSWAMRRFIAWPTLRVRPLTMAQISALASNPIVLPPGLEFQFLEPKRHHGRRERRRRAKLRRRRAWTELRRAARAMLRAMPIIYRPATTEAMRREVNRVALRTRAAMRHHAPWLAKLSRTPGA